MNFDMERRQESGFGFPTSTDSKVAEAPSSADIGVGFTQTSSTLPEATLSRDQDITGTASTLSSSTSAPTGALQTKQPDRDSDSGDGVATGAVAGIAIGSAVAGALIAFLIFFFLFKKRGNRRAGKEAEIEHLNRYSPAMASTEKTTALKGKGLEAGSAALVVESHLPQPLEDDAIASELTKLKILIKNHVQSYYHLSAVDASQIAADTRTIEAALPGTALTPSRLAQFIANPTSRYAALRLAIAWVVISNVDVMSPPETTLLPPAVAKCVETMTGMEGNEEARMAFLSKWCSITSTLMKPTYSRNPFSSSDPRNHNIAKAVDALEALLRPYASDRVSISERRTNLEEIVRRGASFAFLLFSQPSFFTFEWEEQNGTEAGSLVVFPAMLQVADEAAVPLARPRVFGDMEVVRRLA